MVSKIDIPRKITNGCGTNSIIIGLITAINLAITLHRPNDVDNIEGWKYSTFA